MTTATKKCTGCKNRFPVGLDTWSKNNAGNFHMQDCLVSYILAKAVKKREKIEKRQAIDNRKELKKKKATLNNLSNEKKLTQTVINKYVRLRDKGLRCISCNKYEVDMVGYWDSGHYLTVGAHSNIRFNVNNINSQCRDCNGFKGGNPEQHRAGILRRYGQKRLDWLDGYHPLKKYTYDDLARMRKLANKRMKRYM